MFHSENSIKKYEDFSVDELKYNYFLKKLILYLKIFC